ncbi:MAG: hypothetical protein ACRD0K_28995, partial [Egibacteraceae bacterium]
MIPVTLRRLAGVAGGAPRGAQDADSVTIDSQTAGLGALFVPLTGNPLTGLRPGPTSHGREGRSRAELTEVVCWIAAVYR